MSMLATKGLADWKPITDISANLGSVENEAGVYVLRVVGRGCPYGEEFQQRYVAEVTQLSEHKKALFHKCRLTWTPHRGPSFVEGRLGRLKRIEHMSEGDCLLLYIGKSEDLRRRLKELLCQEDRHTVDHPVRALLLNGWRIECAWKPTPDNDKEEDQLKMVFRTEHSGALPPLNDK